MKKILLSLFLTFSLCLSANPLVHDSLENMKVGKITVSVTNAAPGDQGTVDAVLTEMHLKSGDTFSQTEFDSDLKQLSKKYQIVDPVITQKENTLLIHLNITLRPTIIKFTVNGSKYKKKKILDKGELTIPMEYNRGKFYQSITNIRDFLIKKGYFKADVTYKIEETPGTHDAVAHIFINPGPLGHIHNIEFTGFTKKEKSAVYGMIQTSKFNILTNWMTGSGVMKEEEQERDVQTITHHIQNEGYVDAKVHMEVKKTKKDQLTLFFTLDRGELFHIGNIKIEGNTLETESELNKALTVKKGDIFSTDKVAIAQERIKSLYTKKGYLDTSVGYELVPTNGHTYNIVYTVEESDKYKVGLIIVSGNKRTNNNVIYNNVNIVPGEIFDSSKMKGAQYKLQSTGYFKNVSVYAVKNEDLDSPDSQYRNIMVEVDENRTGSFHLSAGANSTAEIFGEISITENNFDINGFATMWADGPNALRGGGQYFDVKAMIAAKDKTASISWINPYLNDSLWRLGMNFEGRKDSTVADYDLWSYGGGVSTTYPLNPYFSSGVKFRVKDSIIRLHDVKKAIQKQQAQNSGVVSGGGLIFNYNSTDNPYVPHRGFKSNFEAEFAGLVRNSKDLHDFPFLKFSYLNSFYVPLWKNGTFKIRGDVRFIKPLWGGQSDDLPLTEKFFLGGVETVRGYAPGQIGPYFELGDPKGGISSQLLSAEFLQKVLPPLDIFTFIDAGAVNSDPFAFKKFYATAGVGVRLHMGQPLPFILGWGYPLNPDKYEGKEGANPQLQSVFFSMSGQF